MAQGTRELGHLANYGRWIVMTVGAAGLLLGCTLNGLIEQAAANNCPESDEPAFPLLSGGFSPASYIRLVLWDGGEPLFVSDFPHGAVDPDEMSPPDLPNGALVPSARLVIDREDDVLVRSYLDFEGRLVEERWRIRGEAP